MPIKLEIYMNNEQKRLREAPVGNQSILMCSARTQINSDNAAGMGFLELMNFTDVNFFNENIKYTEVSAICGTYFCGMLITIH